MSDAAVLSRPQEDLAYSGWIEMDAVPADADLIELPSDVGDALTELDPPTTVFANQEAMRFGPRAYTPKQAQVIQRAVQERRPLRAAPLPIDE